MSEEQIRPSILVDKEAADRYNYIVESGRKHFRNTGIVIPNQEITTTDVEAVRDFNKIIAPTNPDHSWRLTRADRSIARGEIADPSNFANWENPGGPFEHIELATQAAPLILDLLKANPRPGNANGSTSLETQNPFLLAAAAGLHDEGRNITHLFYTNDLIGNRMLSAMGVRADMRSILPNEELMLLPPEQNMSQAINRLPDAAVVIRLADEFGKRVPGSMRLYTPDDYHGWDRQKWADGYTTRPFSGRASEAWWRRRVQTHVDNVPRYFAGLDQWVQDHSTLKLSDVTNSLGKTLNPTLRALQ